MLKIFTNIVLQFLLVLLCIYYYFKFGNVVKIICLLSVVSFLK